MTARTTRGGSVRTMMEQGGGGGRGRGGKAAAMMLVVAANSIPCRAHGPLSLSLHPHPRTRYHDREWPSALACCLPLWTELPAASRPRPWSTVTQSPAVQRLLRPAPAPAPTRRPLISQGHDSRLCVDARVGTELFGSSISTLAGAPPAHAHTHARSITAAPPVRADTRDSEHHHTRRAAIDAEARCFSLVLPHQKKGQIELVRATLAAG